MFFYILILNTIRIIAMEIHIQVMLTFAFVFDFIQCQRAWHTYIRCAFDCVTFLTWATTAEYNEAVVWYPWSFFSFLRLLPSRHSIKLHLQSCLWHRRHVCQSIRRFIESCQLGASKMSRSALPLISLFVWTFFFGVMTAKKIFQTP